MRLVVFGDFNCPYSCLASSRVDALVESGVADVEWRAVEHDPSIPAPSEPADGDVAAALDREVAEVSGLLRPGERFPIVRPPVHPNSGAAVAAFAAAPADEAPELRRRLFAALWFEGRDIGERAVIGDLGGDPHGGAERVGTWRDGWEALDRRIVPMLVLPDGYVSRGLGALARLAELSSTG
jgi:predicted DsbA family dithiol-disulfide isomerase